MHKTHQLRTTLEVEKVHAVVARSTCPSQKWQKLTISDHFWELRGRKSARHCGAKHISKSKVSKTDDLGPLLGVERSKKCTPLWGRSTFPSQKVQNTPFSDHFWKLLWREAHFQVKSVKNFGVRATFDVQMWKRCTPLWREATDHFLTFRCRKSARRCGAKHMSKSKCTKRQMYGRTTFDGWDVVLRGPWQGIVHLVKSEQNVRVCTSFKYNCYYNDNTLPLHYSRLHYTTLHYTTLHYTTPHYTPLHHTTLHYITLHYSILHYTTLHSTTLHYTHYTTLHYITLPSTHFTPLHSITIHYTTPHYTTLHHITLHYTTLLYITLHYIHYITLNALHYTAHTTTTTTTNTTTTRLLYITLGYAT